ncbi:hypothetical protein C0993_009462 [Termitomyces sp. T159_Od127]|nr:hypothetical protein C0993_009462 [Termitomyces sp. T159_Od127]
MSAQKKPVAISTTEGFVCGGIAACIAVTISNPAEVAKTRLQLQGELAKGGGVKVYNNAVDVIRKTYVNEGLRGVQRGLGPAYVYQILLNGSRLGFYEPIRHSINQLAGYSAETQIPFTSVLAGGLSGAIGASLGNPLFLIKARMQAYSPALPVGAQHYYKNSFDALSTIFRAERFRGLVRGIDAAILRTSMGSSVQLPSYNFTKTQLVKNGILPADSTWTFLLSSTISGASNLPRKCLAMQPADTVNLSGISPRLGTNTSHRFQALTRMYNQPTIRGPDGRLQGTLYRNPIDCLWKTFQAEGVRGWYKGTL